jgi:hypothetical protein
MNARKRQQRSDDGNAFLPESAAQTGAGDDLAELLAQKHQLAVTTGEDLDDEAQDAPDAEEIGGPFVETHSDAEFGATRHAPVDESYEASSLPEAVGPLAIASAEEEVEAVEAREEQAEDVDPPDAEGEPPSQLGPAPAQVEAATATKHKRP